MAALGPFCELFARLSPRQTGQFEPSGNSNLLKLAFPLFDRKTGVWIRITRLISFSKSGGQSAKSMARRSPTRSYHCRGTDFFFREVFDYLYQR